MGSSDESSDAREAPAAHAPPHRAPPGTPLYVHLPFCAAKCHYCDFFSVPDQGQDIDGLLDLLLVEAAHAAPLHPRTVYLGGGTPSLLSETQLARVLGELERLTGFRSSAVEVTAECNPESLDRDKARALLDLGVTRLSIGFQSLRPETLALFGRVHDVEQSFRAYAAAREAGVRHVNVDLIFAVPGQTLATWREDLCRITALAPDHISAYDLAFEEETLFKRWLDEGKLDRADEERELELFLATREQLSAAGYQAYEVSNFAMTGEECLHNINYWRNGPYLGLGPSAVSRVGGVRGGNVRSIAGYKRAIERRGSAWNWSETLDPLSRLGETWWLGLRLAEGVDPAEARRTAGLESEDAGDPALAIADGFVGDGWLERSGGRYRTTARGLPVGDALARAFLHIGRTSGEAHARGAVAATTG